MGKNHIGQRTKGLLMAKKAKKKTDKKYLEKYTADNPDVKGDELQGAAFAGCRKDLVKLYKKNKKDIDDMETKTKEMEALQKKINNVNKSKDEIVEGWLKNYPALKTVILSGPVEDDLQQQAAQASTSGSGGKRQKWTPQSLAAALQGNEVALDPEGMATFENLKNVFNAQSIDVLTKRFKCVAGEVVQGKDDKWADAKFDHQHKV